MLCCTPALLDAPAAEVRWLVVDTETEGLDPGRHALLEFAAVLIEGGQAAQLTAGDAQSASLDDALRVAATELSSTGETALVAHNLAFDLSFLAAAGEHAEALARPDRWLCTFLAGDKPRTLDALAAQIGVPVRGRHTAAGDAWCLAAALRALIDRAGASGSVRDMLAPIAGKSPTWEVPDGANASAALLAELRLGLDHVVPAPLATPQHRASFRSVLARAQLSHRLPTDLGQLIGILRTAKVTRAVFDTLAAEDDRVPDT